jgi:hypothetical protein
MPIEFAWILDYIKRAPSDEHVNYRYIEKLLYQVQKRMDLQLIGNMTGWNP